MSVSDLTAGSPLRARIVAGWLRSQLWRLLRSGDALLVLMLFWGYDALCSLRPGTPAAGLGHAQALSTGMFAAVTGWERQLNHLVAQSPAATDACVRIYDQCHYAVTLAVIIWLYTRRRWVWLRLRRGLWGVTAVALVTFYLYPVAPLRFLPGVADLVSRVDGSVVDRADPTMYAAVPSLHVTWACWCAGAVVIAATSRWRWAAAAYPLLISVVVIATGNHALLDVITGAVLGIGAAALSRGKRPLKQPVAQPAETGALPAGG